MIAFVTFPLDSLSTIAGHVFQIARCVVFVLEPRNPGLSFLTYSLLQGSCDTVNGSLEKQFSKCRVFAGKPPAPSLITKDPQVVSYSGLAMLVLKARWGILASLRRNRCK